MYDSNIYLDTGFPILFVCLFIFVLALARLFPVPRGRYHGLKHFVCWSGFCLTYNQEFPIITTIRNSFKIQTFLSMHILVNSKKSHKNDSVSSNFCYKTKHTPLYIWLAIQYQKVTNRLHFYDLNVSFC